MDIYKQILKAIRECKISIQCSSPKLDLLLSLKTSKDSGLPAFYSLIDFKRNLARIIDFEICISLRLLQEVLLFVLPFMPQTTSIQKADEKIFCHSVVSSPRLQRQTASWLCLILNYSSACQTSGCTTATTQRLILTSCSACTPCLFCTFPMWTLATVSGSPHLDLLCCLQPTSLYPAHCEGPASPRQWPHKESSRVHHCARQLNTNLEAASRGEL